MSNDRTLGEAVGANLNAQRVKHAQTQAQAARHVQACGLSWNQDHVASLENGKRSTIRLDELLALSAAYEVPLADWFKGDGKIHIAGHVSMSCAEIRDALSGQVPGAQMVDLDFSQVDDALVADRRAAQRLGVDEQVIAHAAEKLWGHTLTQERDKRLGEAKDPAAARTLRAGMTKRLIREIEPHTKGSES